MMGEGICCGYGKGDGDGGGGGILSFGLLEVVTARVGGLLCAFREIPRTYVGGGWLSHRYKFIQSLNACFSEPIGTVEISHVFFRDCRFPSSVPPHVCLQRHVQIFLCHSHSNVLKQRIPYPYTVPAMA